VRILVFSHCFAASLQLRHEAYRNGLQSRK
jgi:hypothetical protein